MPSDVLQKTPEGQPPLYSISREEFLVQPKDIQPYKPGDKVTRENFVNFLILSYAISMGQPAVQYFFMQWLRLKYGFDYSSTLDNFLDTGGWKVLSENERNKFKQQFYRVSKHREKVGSEEAAVVESKIANEITSLCAKHQGYLIKPSQIAGFNTYAEFLKFAQEEVVRQRAMPR